MPNNASKKIALALALTSLCASVAGASRIVVNNDEWTFTNYGYAAAGGTGTFATNVASWLTAGSANNKVAILSSNFGFDTQFEGSLTSLGLNVTHTTAAVNLSDYSAVFLGGDPVDNTALINYVNGGGNVYLAGGTGWGGPVAEAAQWNPFLNSFGMAFGDFYNGACCTMAPPASHAIFNGVGDLYMNNGNNAIDLVAGSGAQVVWSQGSNGLIAVYDGNTAAVPEPTSLALMAAGLGLVGFAARRKSK